MRKLEGRVALVTGAARGLGRGIAMALADEGAIVAVNDLTIDADLESAIADIRNGGGHAFPLAADVTDPAAIRRAIDEIDARGGRLDIMVNNAGTLPRGLTGRTPFEEMSLDYWNAYLALNLTSVFLCSQAALPLMRRQRFGRIINIASQMAFKGHPDLVPYCAAKGGVISFTRALARRVADDGITVNAIAPGPILTGAHKREGMTDDDMDRQASGLPLKRFARVEEIAPTAVLLASSPDGDFYTGVTFHPNGGDVML
jgi:3-oxoacyl-[acyl-carrier protein] reductase